MTDDPANSGPKPTPDVLSTESLMMLTREDLQGASGDAGSAGPAGPADPALRRRGAGESPMQGWPAAAAVVVLIVLAAMAIHLDHYPLIPFVAIAIVCIRNWAHRWARTVWYVTLTVYALWLLIHTVPLWLPFFFALLAAYIMSPVVDGIERGIRRLKVPFARTFAVVSFFVVALGGIVILDIMFIHNARSTVDQLVQGFNERDQITNAVVKNVDRLKQALGMGALSAEQTEGLTAWTDRTLASTGEDLTKFGQENAQALFGHAAELFGALAVLAFDFLIFLFATFYLLIDFPKLSAKVDSWFSPQRSIRLARLSSQIGKILRSYLQGHTAVCVLVGLIYFLVLAIFGHPYAPLLGLLMGVLSLIPFLGPITAGLLSIVLTLTVGLDPATAVVDPGTAMLGVIVAYAVAHGLNDTVLYPLIAGRAVHISPVETLLVLFVVGHFFGILGMFFAVPLWAIVRKLVTWMNEEHIPGFEWLKLFRPYEVRHERTLRLQRQEVERKVAQDRAETEYQQRLQAGLGLSLSSASERLLAATDTSVHSAETGYASMSQLESLDDDLPPAGADEGTAPRSDSGSGAKPAGSGDGNPDDAARPGGDAGKPDPA